MQLIHLITKQAYHAMDLDVCIYVQDSVSEYQMGQQLQAVWLYFCYILLHLNFCELDFW